MTTIDVSTGIRDALKQAAANTSKAPAERKGGGAANPEPTDPRAVRDTVTLSDGANKIINLNRAQELGDDLKNAPAGEDFSKNLAQASKDMMRIMTLFSETMKSLFARWR